MGLQQFENLLIKNDAKDVCWGMWQDIYLMILFPHKFWTLFQVSTPKKATSESSLTFMSKDLSDSERYNKSSVNPHLDLLRIFAEEWLTRSGRLTIDPVISVLIWLVDDSAHSISTLWFQLPVCGQNFHKKSFFLFQTLHSSLYCDEPSALKSLPVIRRANS